MLGKMNRFGNAGKLIQNGYRWCDHRDTLPRREYGKTKWNGKFPDGSVDADLKSFELGYCGRGRFDVTLESCPEGVQISMEITAKICEIDGVGYSHEKWKIGGLSAEDLNENLLPMGDFRTLLPPRFWVKSVSIRNVKRTAIGGQSADSSGISVGSNTQDANSSGFASANVSEIPTNDEQSGSDPKKIHVEPDSSETEESSDRRPDYLSSGTDDGSSEEISSSDDEIGNSPAYQAYMSRFFGKSTGGVKTASSTQDSSVSNVSAKSASPMAKSPPTDSYSFQRRVGQSTSAATGDSQVGVKFSGDGKFPKGKSPVPAKKKKLTKRRQK